MQGEFHVGDWLARPQLNSIQGNGQTVHLEPKVMELLVCLAEHAGDVVTKEKLISVVWHDTFVGDEALTNAVWKLRETFGDDSKNPRFIQTISKTGYRLIAPVVYQAAETRTDSNQGSASPQVEPVRRSEIPKRPMLLALAAVALSVVGSIYLVFNLIDSRKPPHKTAAPVHKQITFTGKASRAALSPDGQSVAYVSGLSETEMKVMVQNLSGGEALELFTGQNCGNLRWSPDGSSLMFFGINAKSGGGIFLVSRFGGTPRRLTGGRNPSWSPDGSQVAFVRSPAKKIFLKKLSGEETFIPLSGSFRWLMDVDWSPSGDLFVFLTHDDHARRAIWTIKTDGSQQEKILEDSLEITSVRWSPQGNAIYYFRRRAQTTELCKYIAAPSGRKATTGESVVLTGIQEKGEGEFTLSGDARRLVYSQELGHSNLWLATITGSGKDPEVRTKQLTSGTALIESPSVSPDGGSVAFQIGRQPPTNLYTIPITGGSPRQLTFFNSLNNGAVWSPDNKQLAFMSTETGSPKVWVVNAGGGAPRELSRSEISNDSIAWTPGPRILYHRPGNRNFHILDARTGEDTPLVKNETVGWMFNPVWSPDGKKVAVNWNRSPSPGIWVISLSDARQVLVHKSRAFMELIGWSRDGDWIYAREGVRKIVKIPSKGGEPATVAALPFQYIGSITMASDERQFACTVFNMQSDVWMVENFDPPAQVRTATTAASSR